MTTNTAKKSAAPKSYRDLLCDASKLLYDASETPRIDAEYLMQHVLQQSMAWLISYGDSPASADHTRAFYQLIEQRAKGVPVAYLMGYRDFWTLRLEVNEHVLIPRGDTEIIVEQALERIPPNAAQSIVDLGTGSGAIALSIAKERSTCSVVAIDKQHEALDVAKRNANANDIENVTFMQSDWFDALDDQQFHLIASNPPYIEPNDAHLQQGDLRFEPSTALIAQDQGLSDLKIIIEQARQHLHTEGWLLLEHGFQQAAAVEELLSSSGYQHCQLYADLNHLPRCTASQWLG